MDACYATHAGLEDVEEGNEPSGQGGARDIIIYPENSTLLGPGTQSLHSAN